MTACGRFQNELIGVMYGEADASSASAELRSHLAACEACTALLQETRGLLGELGSVLRPEPLSERTVRLIAIEVDNLSIQVRRQDARRSTRLRPLWSAAAAAVLLFAWKAGLAPLQQSTVPQSSEPTAIAALTDEESAAVAEAFAILYVDGSSEVQLEYASERLDSLRKRISGNDRTLPWTADDDWDLPRPTSG